MAVVIKSITRQSEETKTMDAVLYADAKTDVSTGMTFFDGYVLEAGSTCYTKDGDVGIVDSTGAFNWIGD